MTRIGLCIGVDEYEDSEIANLRCAHRDAHAVAHVLQRLGFEAEALAPRDMSVDAVYRRIRQAGARITAPDDVLLIFFAGHGKTLQSQRVSDQLLLLPSASMRSLERGLVAGAPGVLSFLSLHAELDHLPGQCALVLDACRLPLSAREMAHRDGANTARFEGERVFRGLTPRSHQPGSRSRLSVLNSCSDGERAEELPDYPGGGHGIFTAAWVEWLGESGRQGELMLSGETIRSELQPRLDALAGRYRLGDVGQCPSWSGPPLRLAARAAQTSTQGAGDRVGASRDERLWKLACVKNSVEAYEQYLRESGDCAHEEAALEKIRGLLAAAQPPTVERPSVQDGAQRPASGSVTRRQALESFRDLPEAPEMVVLPRGRFLMGSPEGEEGRNSNQSPQHEVRIAYDLAVGKYAVTFDEWDACVADGGTEYVPDDEGWGRGRHPVINVSWQDAQDYLRWLNRKAGLSNKPKGEQYRLLSEAEWEYAARAGTTGPFGFEGVISPAKVNYYSNDTYGGSAKDSRGYRGRTVEVGSLPANRWGLHEMHGNVREWVQDCWHDNYSGAPTDGSAWTTGCSRVGRVLRGGSWYNKPGDVRSANRLRYSTSYRSNSIGFRVARMLP